MYYFCCNRVTSETLIRISRMDKKNEKLSLLKPCKENFLTLYKDGHHRTT